MIGFAHMILHVGLCNAVAHVAPEATIPIRVHLSDATGRQQIDQQFHVQRGYDPTASVEMDVPRGTFRMILSVPGTRCSAVDYLVFLSERDRNVTQNLSDTPMQPPEPMLLAGTAPQAFLYVKPTFALFDKAATACNKPVSDPLPSNINVENDQTGFYVWLYSDAQQQAHGPVIVALKLGTATGEFHYVRLPVTFPVPWRGWPFTYQFDVSEDVIDGLAGQPVNTLLCPKIYTTSVG